MSVDEHDSESTVAMVENAPNDDNDVVVDADADRLAVAAPPAPRKRQRKSMEDRSDADQQVQQEKWRKCKTIFNPPKN